MRVLTLETSNGLLEYTVTHRRRITKRLHMELDDHGGLVVVAPEHWSGRHIRSTLLQNTSRVERFLVRARERRLRPLLYTNHERHLYLGEKYPLSILSQAARRSSVVFTGSEIRIDSRDHRPEKIQADLHAWYHEQASEVLAARLQVVAARAEWVGTDPVPMKLRRMKRTWGNCSSGGLIKLNTHLIKAPLEVIDSVIAHELCHLEEMNHGKRFYALLEQLNPNWQRDRSKLRSEGNLYLL